MRLSAPPSLLVSAAIVLLLAFAFLGTRSLWDPDEGRYTNVALNMLESGDWIHPMRNEHIGHWTKPPLTYWVIAASVGVFGYNPWAARLPYALAYLFCAWMVWRIARRIMPGEENKAALVYATMFLPFGAAQMVTTDFLLSAALSMAMMAWIESRFDDPQRSRRWVLLMWVGFALGFLIKGPPALLPLLAVIATIRLLPAPRSASVFHWSSLLVFAVVALPWYVIVVRDTAGLLDYFLGREVVDRIATSDFGRHGEWYGWLEIYLPTLVVGTLPWTLPLWRWIRSLGASLKAWRNPQTRSADAVGLTLFLWIVVPLLIFCIARSRLPLYLLPLFTPLALVVARQMRLDGAQLSAHAGARHLGFPARSRSASPARSGRPTRMPRNGPTRSANGSPIRSMRSSSSRTWHATASTCISARRVDKISREPLDDKAFDPDYDSDLQTELAKGAADVVYISKEDRWPDLQRRIEASGRVATALGERYQGRVIFSVTPRQP